MNFAISYSGGKDSALALHRMRQKGHTPVALLTTINKQLKRSWFHGIDEKLLHATAHSLEVPLIQCICEGEAYHLALEEGMNQAKAMGAEACVFGDIDIQGHYEWCSERCHNVKLDPVFPLWQESRERIVYEFVECGFHALIKCVRLDILDKTYLGQMLTHDLIKHIAATGADICGENGEYHTFVYDGPIFKYPIDIIKGDVLDFGSHGAMDIRLHDLS